MALLTQAEIEGNAIYCPPDIGQGSINTQRQHSEWLVITSKLTARRLIASPPLVDDTGDKNPIIHIHFLSHRSVPPMCH